MMEVKAHRWHAAEPQALSPLPLRERVPERRRQPSEGGEGPRHDREAQTPLPARFARHPLPQGERGREIAAQPRVLMLRSPPECQREAGVSKHAAGEERGRLVLRDAPLQGRRSSG